ncbi:hypothetical protein FDG2_2573 [Candidatus Protofrankia californiensis]|uniref:Uncharacterized protein n=1 Tax=Candidatus Protofrankia californiensis TaxID=1839754 RepID=A0A1C3NXX5_9ACTN|nr:hypothetical protein FDG2_2573 [Candidatus Protofrankia californiensis]
MSLSFSRSVASIFTGFSAACSKGLSAAQYRVFLPVLRINLDLGYDSIRIYRT